MRPPAAPTAVRVVVLVHHCVDQSLLSQSAPRNRRVHPEVLKPQERMTCQPPHNPAEFFKQES